MRGRSPAVGGVRIDMRLLLGGSWTIFSLIWGCSPLGAWLFLRAEPTRKRDPGVVGAETDVCPSPVHRRIVDRMDHAGDGDGWVSLAELRAWIAHTQQRHIRDSVSAAWDTYDTDRDGRVGWEELRNATYGYYTPGRLWDPPALNTHLDPDLFDPLILRTFSPLAESLTFDLWFLIRVYPLPGPYHPEIPSL